jgi:hypothetical protein
MKRASQLLFAVLIFQTSYAQGTFENLDFESAKLPVIPVGHFGNSVSPEDAIPGWIPYGASVFHNSVSLGGPGITIYGPDWNSSEIFQGDYSLQMNADFYGLGSIAAIGQTGHIPANSMTIVFDAQPPLALGILFDGRLLQLRQLESRNTYNVYGADISHFSGKIGELRIVAGDGLFDNIQFLATPSVTGRDPDLLAEWTSHGPTNEMIWDGVFTPSGFLLASKPPNSFLRSSDGAAWAGINIGEEMRSIAFGNELFVAGASNGGVYTSTNSQIWQLQSSPTTKPIIKLVYGNDEFLALDGAGKVYRSTNGVSWTPANLDCCIASLAYGKGIYLAGGGQTASSMLFSSTNGVNWNDRLADTTNTQLGTVTTIVYGNQRFTALAGAKLLTSNDGTKWALWPFTEPIRPLAFGGNLFFGLDDGRLATSTDGVSWIVRETTMPALVGFIYGAGRYIAYGPNGTILQSGYLNKILNIQRNNGFTVVSYAGVYGRTYTLQASTNLVDWLDSQSAPDVLGNSLFQVPDSAPLKFYRLLLQ